MSHITKEEYLSAFIDGESGSFEQQRLSDQLGADDLMQEKLTNFALIGESMRNQSQPMLAGTSFLAGIQDAIAEDECVMSVEADEQQVQASNVIDKKRFFPRQTVGYAVAASVAAIAAVSLQNYLVPVSSDLIVAKTTPMVEQVAAPKMMAASINVEPKQLAERVSYAAPDAEMRGLINEYVALHLQYASTSTLMPRVRAVSYSTDF